MYSFSYDPYDYEQEQAERNRKKEREELGLPPERSNCFNGSCDIFKSTDPTDALYRDCTELQTVALFLGYQNGRRLGTDQENFFTTMMQDGSSGGDIETVKSMLRDIVKPQPSTERKAAVRTLKDYQKSWASQDGPAKKMLRLSVPEAVSTASVVVFTPIDPKILVHPSTTPLMKAVYHHEGLTVSEEIKTLVAQTKDINEKNYVDGTVMHFAMFKGNLPLINYLIDAGAKVNVRNTLQQTPLQIAAVISSYSVVELLIEKGADVNAEENHRATALHWAICYDRSDKDVTLLLDKQASVNARTMYLCTPLLIAVRCGNLSIVKLLLGRGADKSLPDDRGDTPLHIAAAKGFLEIVECLCSHGVKDLDVENLEKATPLAYAGGNGHTLVVEFLIRNGANVCAKDNVNRTPLHWAAAGGQRDAVDYMCKNGADINHQDATQSTAYDHALERGHTAVVECLAGHGAKPTNKNGVDSQKKLKL